MTLVFDSSILVDLEHKTAKTLKFIKEITQNHPAPPATTVISHYEFLWGLRYRNQSYKDAQNFFINKFIILQTSRVTPILLCNIRDKYESRGISIPLPDLIIASLTIENNMTLLTKDRDFEKIEELKKIIL